MTIETAPHITKQDRNKTLSDLLSVSKGKKQPNAYYHE